MVNILIYLLILAVTNIFGIFNILEDYRLPGIGKPSDFILIIMVLAITLKLLYRKVELNKKEKKLIKIVLAIVFYVFFLTFYSSFITGRESFNYALRTAAPYLYYISFLFPILFVTRKKQLIQFINFLRIGGLATGIIAIISNLVGYSIVTGVVSGETGSFIRVYLPIFFNFFVVTFWTVQFFTKRNIEVKIHYLEMIINALGIVLFLGRTLMIAVVFALLYLIWFFSKSSVRNKRKAIFLFTVFALGIMVSFLVFNFSPADFIERFQAGYTHTIRGTSTLSYRLNAISQGFQVFAQMPLFGTGFIHPTTSYYLDFLISKEGFAITNSADFGLASILFTTGLIGFSLITYFVIRNLVYIKQELNKMLFRKDFNILFVYSLSIFTIVVFVYFIEQIAGNEFGFRVVAIYSIALGFIVKMTSLNNFEKKKSGL